MYPAFDWSFAPGHHGYQRACVLIRRPASTGQSGSAAFASAGTTRTSISSQPLAARLDATLKTLGFEPLIDRAEIYEAARHAHGVAYRTSVRVPRSDIRSRSS